MQERGFILNSQTEVSLYGHYDQSEHLFDEYQHAGPACGCGISMVAFAYGLGSICKRGHKALLAPSEGSHPGGSPSAMD